MMLTGPLGRTELTVIELSSIKKYIISIFTYLLGDMSSCWYWCLFIKTWPKSDSS